MFYQRSHRRQFNYKWVKQINSWYRSCGCNDDGSKA